MTNRAPERTAFLTDLLICGIEGGVNYWATCLKYKIWADSKDTDKGYRPDAFAVLVDSEDYWNDEEDESAERFTVTADVIAKGINLIASGEIGYYNSGYPIDSGRQADEPHFRLRRLNQTNGEDDALGDYDAADADAIIQAGLFGEVRYG